MEVIFLIVAVTILFYGLFSNYLTKSVLSAPLTFVAAGLIVSQLGILANGEQWRDAIKHLAEITLVIMLFTDASRIDLRLVGKQYGIPIRLLGIGLPLTVVLGALLARLIIPELAFWEAALLGAILAPTDAALGQPVVASESVPKRIRQTLNVESGLNDGIVVPIVMLCAALATATTDAGESSQWLGYWIAQVSLGPIVGILVGCLGAWGLELATRSGWMEGSFRRLSGVALAIVAWAVATEIGNGFLAAFSAGVAVGYLSNEIKPAIQDFAETEGQLLALVTFFLFGALLLPDAIAAASLNHYIYAVMSLTLIRMLPVALVLLGTGFRWSTIGFIAWFGPRGLASLIFALLVFNEHNSAGSETILHSVVITASLSVLLHGITAAPAAKWYGNLMSTPACREGCEHHEMEPPSRN